MCLSNPPSGLNDIHAVDYMLTDTINHVVNIGISKLCI